MPGTLQGGAAHAFYNRSERHHENECGCGCQRCQPGALHGRRRMRGDFRAAGEEELSRACAALGGCETGQAVITPGFGLSAQYIVHAVGPVYRDGRHGEAALLRACYLNALTLAAERGCRSIACPLISSGSYGYPKSEAFGVAAAAIASFLQEHEMTVYLACLTVRRSPFRRRFSARCSSISTKTM